MAILAKSLSLERSLSHLSAAFALIGLLRTCIGLYGTIAYIVGQRTSEIGVCLALGSGRGKILAMVIVDTLAVVPAGLAVGVPLTWMASRVLTSQLYGVKSHDTGTLLLTLAAIVGVSLLAGAIPARRAASIDPMAALRHE